MERWLKGLVAITCLVIIGGIAYLIWKDQAELNRDALANRAAAAAAYESSCAAALDNLIAYKNGASSAVQGSFADNKKIVRGCIERLTGTEFADGIRHTLIKIKINVDD